MNRFVCLAVLSAFELWRAVKYEERYLKAYSSVPEARMSIGRYLDFYKRSGRRLLDKQR